MWFYLFGARFLKSSKTTPFWDAQGGTRIGLCSKSSKSKLLPWSRGLCSRSGRWFYLVLPRQREGRAPIRVVLPRFYHGFRAVGPSLADFADDEIATKLALEPKGPHSMGGKFIPHSFLTARQSTWYGCLREKKRTKCPDAAHGMANPVRRRARSGENISVRFSPLRSGEAESGSEGKERTFWGKSVPRGPSWFGEKTTNTQPGRKGPIASVPAPSFAASQAQA